MTISITGNLVIDEAIGLQTDDDDNDVASLSLNATLAAFLASLTTASATGFPQYAARTNLISNSDPVQDYKLVANSNGDSFPAGGVNSGLTDLDGNVIFLFGGSDDNVVIGRVGNGTTADPLGEVAFAIILNETKDGNGVVTAVSLSVAQYEPLFHDGVNQVDDADVLDLSNLVYLKSTFSQTTSVNFSDYSAVPSGQDVFAMIAPTGSNQNVDLLVTGFAGSTEGTVNVSTQGLGTNSQAIDQNESLRIDFVNGGDNTKADTAPEVHDAANIAYTDHFEGNGGSFQLMQTNPSKTTVSATVSAYNVVGDAKGVNFISDAHASNGATVSISGVKVYDAAHQEVTTGITLTGVGTGTVKVDGLKVGYFVEFTTSAAMDRFTVTNSSSQSNRAFDIGNITVSSTSTTTFNDVHEIGSHIIIEDSGPDVALTVKTGAELTVDESTLPATDSILVADLFSVNLADYGADGQAASGASVYKLVLGDTHSALTDTLTGEEVLLSINGAGTQITGKVDGGTKTVFTIDIDATTGTVTLTQSRSMVNGDPSDPDESLTPLTLADNLVQVSRTITDKDGDTDTDAVNIGHIFHFEDAGPTQGPATQDPVALIVDDSALAVPDTLTTDDLFPVPPNFGSDGPLDTDHNGVPDDGAVVNSLRLTAEGADSGLIDTASGKHVLLKTVGAAIVGYVDTNGNLALDPGETTEVIRFSLTPVDSDTDTISVLQSRAVVHSDITQSDETVGPLAAGKIFIDRIAVDGDGDTAEKVSFDLGAITFVKDDGPTLTGVDNGTANFAVGSHATDAYSSHISADGGAVTITDWADLSSVGLTGVLSNNGTVLTYYAGANNTDPVYKLTVTNTGYDFEVLKTLTSPPETLNFNAIKSGGPQETLSVPTSGGHVIVFDGLLFTGNGPGATATKPDFVPFDLNAAPGDDLNPDAVGFGVKNGQASQVNHNEGFFFNTNTGLDVLNLQFDVAGIGNLNQIHMESWMYNDAGELVDHNDQLITGLNSGNKHVSIADDGGSGAHSAADELFDVAYVRFYFDPVDTNAGVRVLNFSTQLAVQTNDRSLPFQLTNADGDGDTAVQTFNVLVDNPLSSTVDTFFL